MTRSPTASARSPAAARSLPLLTNGLRIDVREYLIDVLTRLPVMKADEAAALTPANWHKARQAVAKAKAA